MSKRRSSNRGRRSSERISTLTALALALIIAGCATVEKKDVAKSVSGAGAKQATKAKPAGGPQEGIKVHGQWTIEVRNPDGTLVSRREFENAFFANDRLAKILGRVLSVGRWQVRLDGVWACFRSTGMAAPCYLAETVDPATESHFFKNLSVNVPTSGPDTGKVVLSGTATAQKDGNVGQVVTHLYTCAASVAPDACPGMSADSVIFTGTTLSAPIPVVTGQLIQVTVRISFS